MRKTFAVWLLAAVVCRSAGSEPAAGDVFREYRWFHEKGDAGQSMRVGGRERTVYPFLDSDVAAWPRAFDLEEAVKAEVIAEKVLCHDGTAGLAIQINDGSWFYFPEADAIPAPQARYQHHTFPVVRVPLSVFKQGTGNTFRLRVDKKHPWNWPQNLINGLHVRIYYDPARKPHPKGTVMPLKNGGAVGSKVNLAVAEESPQNPVSRVDYIGLYDDVNFEGDGIYRQWHYLYLHGQLLHHMGSAAKAPFTVQWDTSWLPDQKEPMQVAARITDSAGITYQTEAVTGLVLQRNDISVELCRPYGVPKQWVTRSGEKTQYFDVNGDLKKAQAAQLAWSSWSPGYMRGISINGTKVFDREGPCYRTFYHRVTLDSCDAFRRGRNILATGKTPRINGRMVHGMEVNWPGIMVLIRYEK